MFYLIGLGLGDAGDITVKGLEIVKRCKRVYLEAYTSILGVGKEALNHGYLKNQRLNYITGREEFYGREVILADRDAVEQGSDELLAGAEDDDIAFLVVGDPFGATTHSDLVLRAVEKNIPYKTIHNASIMNAVGCCGLQLYNFGETVSIVFWDETWKPESFYDKIVNNKSRGMHTLCLLDIKVKEQSIENLMRGRKIYEPPRYMSVSQAARQLMEIVQNRSRSGEKLVVDGQTLCIGLARVGQNDQLIKSGTLEQLMDMDFGNPLHSLLVCGEMHPIELEFVKIFTIGNCNR